MFEFRLPGQSRYGGSHATGSSPICLTQKEVRQGARVRTQIRRIVLNLEYRGTRSVSKESAADGEWSPCVAPPEAANGVSPVGRSILEVAGKPGGLSGLCFAQQGRLSPQGIVAGGS